MEQIAKALKLKSELDKLRPIGKEQEAIIMQKFRLDWNYHSNHLEGNSLSFGETKALILFGITAQGKPLKDHFEITGHDEAIKWVEEIIKGEYPLTENFIRQLHTLLLKESYEIDAITPDGQPTKKRIEVGKYKSTPNHVKTKTGEIFRFATPEETPAMMHDLINWYREKRNLKDVNPVIFSSEFHYKFIRIHPFDDGNGRVARILMNFILMQFGYPPVIIKTEDKGNYFSALQQADSGNIEIFVDYIAKNLNRSLEIMIAGAQGKNIEEPDDLDKEIIFLEQKLKSTGKKIEKVKSRVSILDIYDNSISKLCQKFIDANSKFNKFYIENKFRIKIQVTPSGGYITSHNPSILRDDIKENTENIELEYLFDILNIHGYGEISHLSKILISFKKINYKIWFPDEEINKPYSEQLTDAEIDEIVKSETKRHKDFIESKLKEKKS